MSQTKQTLGREEEAEEMLQHTSITPRLAWCSIVLFVLTLLSVPALQYLRGGRGTKAEPAVPASATKPAQWWSALDALAFAPDIKKFEENLESSSVFFSQVRPHVQEFLTGKLRAGNAQVYPGNDGWLFYRQEIDYVTGPGFLDPAYLRRRSKFGTRPDPLPALVDFRNQLAKRGIKLMLMPAPAKVTLYPEKLVENYTGRPPQNPSFDKFCQLAEAEGIPVFDPTEVLLKAKRETGEDQFVPIDTHWSPVAVEHAARALARYIEKMDVLPSRPPVDYEYVAGQSRLPGDLLRLMGLPTDQKLYPGQELPYRAVRRKYGKVATADQEPDVLVLGDSFGGIYDQGKAGLANQLSYFMKRPVVDLTVPNGGSFAAREKLIREIKKGNDRLRGMKLVIYEFTVRDLGYGHWKMLDLPPAPIVVATPTPSVTPSTTPSPTRMLTPTSAQTATPAPTPTRIPTATPTSTRIPTPAPTSTLTSTPTRVPTPTKSPIPTRTPTLTPTPARR